MDKHISTPALLSDNAPLLPENCCNYKCFGIHMLISIICIGTTQKSREEKPNLIYYHTELLKWTGKNDCHLFKIVRNNCISSMYCSFDSYLTSIYCAGNIEITLATSSNGEKLIQYLCCMSVFTTLSMEKIKNLKPTSPSPEILMVLCPLCAMSSIS